MSAVIEIKITITVDGGAVAVKTTATESAGRSTPAASGEDLASPTEREMERLAGIEPVVSGVEDHSSAIELQPQPDAYTTDERTTDIGKDDVDKSCGDGESRPVGCEQPTLANASAASKASKGAGIASGPQDPISTDESARLCGCEKCVDARIDAMIGWRRDPLLCVVRGPSLPGWRFACEICGNKRCPHHTDHTLDCTGSNGPGQPGSSWEHYPKFTDESATQDATPRGCLDGATTTVPPVSTSQATGASNTAAKPAPTAGIGTGPIDDDLEIPPVLDRRTKAVMT